MNRAKSYRVLIIILFFIFISLLSRSLIYLAVSLTVAVIIVILLSRDMQRKKVTEKGSGRPVGTERKSSTPGSLFPAVFLVFGAVMASYGFSGYFGLDGFFHTFGIMTEETFVLIFLLLTGIILFLYGLTLLLKSWLSN